MIAEGELPRRPTPERVIAGTLLAILLSGTAFWLGPERHSFAESLGAMAILGGPFFFIFAIFLARYTAEREERNQPIRAALVPLGMGLLSLMLLVALLLLAPVLKLWSFVLLVYLFLPTLAGGAGLGLGCLIRTRRPTRRERP